MMADANIGNNMSYDFSIFQLGSNVTVSSCQATVGIDLFFTTPLTTLNDQEMRIFEEFLLNKKGVIVQDNSNVKAAVKFPIKVGDNVLVAISFDFPQQIEGLDKIAVPGMKNTFWINARDIRHSVLLEE